MTPDVRVVRGEPDDDELAALVAGLAASSHPPATDHTLDPAPRAARRWRAAARPPERALVPGPDAWRWSVHG